MSLIADGVLIATCLTTAIYCVMLSRRLKRLSATDEGIGQQILRLNTVLDETKAAVAEIQGTTRAASEDLAGEIETARRLGDQLQRQIARAMKNGVGRREPDPLPASSPPDPPVTARTTGAAAALAMKGDEHAVAEEVPVVDFEAAEEIDGPEEAFAGDRDDDEGFEEVLGDDPESVDDDMPESPDDIAEASDHWPFDESGEATATDEDLSEEARVEGDEPATGTSNDVGREAVAGLLRVERMAV